MPRTDAHIKEARVYRDLQTSETCSEGYSTIKKLADSSIILFPGTTSAGPREVYRRPRQGWRSLLSA